MQLTSTANLQPPWGKRELLPLRSHHRDSSSPSCPSGLFLLPHQIMKTQSVMDQAEIVVTPKEQLEVIFTPPDEISHLHIDVKIATFPDPTVTREEDSSSSLSKSPFQVTELGDQVDPTPSQHEDDPQTSEDRQDFPHDGLVIGKSQVENSSAAEQFKAMLQAGDHPDPPQRRPDDENSSLPRYGKSSFASYNSERVERAFRKQYTSRSSKPHRLYGNPYAMKRRKMDQSASIGQTSDSTQEVKALHTEGGGPSRLAAAYRTSFSSTGGDALELDGAEFDDHSLLDAVDLDLSSDMRTRSMPSSLRSNDGSRSASSRRATYLSLPGLGGNRQRTGLGHNHGGGQELGIGVIGRLQDEDYWDLADMPDFPISDRLSISETPQGSDFIVPTRAGCDLPFGHSGLLKNDDTSDVAMSLDADLPPLAIEHPARAWNSLIHSLEPELQPIIRWDYEQLSIPHSPDQGKFHCENVFRPC